MATKHLHCDFDLILKAGGAIRKGNLLLDNNPKPKSAVKRISAVYILCCTNFITFALKRKLLMSGRRRGNIYNKNGQSYPYSINV